jgi:hypothetical protein
MFIPTSLWKET